MLRHLDLFSGIGGFSLAVDRAFGKSEHIFCEIDPFCVEVLKKHWPNAKIYGDIRTLTTDTKHSGQLRTQEVGTDSGTQPESQTREELSKSESTGASSLRAEETGWDLLTGGFPCQPFSQAGRRKGTDDDRYLWPEMFRVIREFKPTWVIAENVRGLVTWNEGMVLEQVCADLESEDYEVQPLIIPAVAVGAPHRRDRVWFVAHKLNTGLEGGSEETKRYSGQCSGERSNQEQDIDVEDAFSLRSKGRVEDSGQVLGRKSTEVKDERPSWEENWVEVATRLCRVDDGLSRRLDRNPRLKALGNAIVPQVAEEILKAIKKVW